MGVDNIVVIAILVGKLPPGRGDRIRTAGIGAATTTGVCSRTDTSGRHRVLARLGRDGDGMANLLWITVAATAVAAVAIEATGTSRFPTLWIPLSQP